MLTGLKTCYLPFNAYPALLKSWISQEYLTLEMMNNSDEPDTFIVVRGKKEINFTLFSFFSVNLTYKCVINKCDSEYLI